MLKKTVKSTDTLIGQNIRANRLTQGLSQSELAKRIGVTFQQVQKYEKGTNRVGGSRLIQIAEALSIPAVALLENAENGRVPNPANCRPSSVIRGRSACFAPFRKSNGRHRNKH